MAFTHGSGWVLLDRLIVHHARRLLLGARAPLLAALFAAFAVAGRAEAQTAPGAGTSEPRFDVIEEEEAGEPQQEAASNEESGRLEVGASALAGASDEKETSAAAVAGFGVLAGWHFSPEVAAIASLHYATVDQPYLLGAGPEESFSEQRRDLLGVADWRIAHRLGGILSPHAFLGPRYLALTSPVYQPWMIAAALGTRMEFWLDEGLVADGEITWAHPLANEKDPTSALGSFKTTWLYGGGLALRFAPHFRLRFGYRGETWTLERTNRVLHAAEVGLVIRAL